MIYFGDISEQEFLADYWQKKPLLIKQALPDFISPITPDELAGLSLEDEFESRLIQGSVGTEQWTVKNGAFSEKIFAQLPEQNWTLLVQGVDRYIDEVHDLIRHFDFIPRWRFDDVMISYATTGGSVGPHFDYYDVFLLQGSGKRRWQLSTQHCELDNYLGNIPLRIMNVFETEQVFDVESGDVLYIPPKVAHHGVSLDDECTTLSFGYRAYSTQEIAEFMTTNIHSDAYYQDPVWTNNNTPAFICTSAIQQAQKILNIDAEAFARFVTKLGPLDEQLLQYFEPELFDKNTQYRLHPACKIAYLLLNKRPIVFINGEQLETAQVNDTILIDFCNTRHIQNNINANFSKLLFEMGLLV